MSVFGDVPVEALSAEALERLRRMVELESPSDDEVRLRAAAGDFAGALAELGLDVDTEDVPGVGEHVVGRWSGTEPELDPVVVLGHLDTVHPVGTFDPVFRVEDGRAAGPGTFDMKGGWACFLTAAARLAGGAGPRRPVVVLATCDEETGSETSRALIESVAEGAHAVLVPEPSMPDGSAKTRRKGVGWYRLDVDGRAAHAGVAPEEGVNAIVELAHRIVAITGLADPSAGTTVSVGEVGGGTASNVVPARAWATVDVRFSTPAEGARVDEGVRSLSATVDGARVRVSGGINRPPMERTEAIAALWDRARELAAEAGWVLGEGSSGGASDGSITAGLGVPTLDGLGPMGDGAHADHEHVLVTDLGRRALLYGRLLETL